LNLYNTGGYSQGINFSQKRKQYAQYGVVLRVTGYLAYYHTGRVHQGLGRIIDPRHEANTGEIFCRERLGGLLKSYHRKAA
jgi:hypothetical protein